MRPKTIRTIKRSLTSQRLAECNRLLAEHEAQRDALLADAHRLLTAAYEGEDDLGAWGDVKDWIRAYDAWRVQ